MKKIIVLLFILFLDCSNDDSATLNWNDLSIDLSGVELSNVIIYDDNFELFLETHNADGGDVEIGANNSMGDGILNNLVPKVKIENVTQLNVNSLDIESISGISSFISLQYLDCSNNQIQNISLNEDLLYLNCSNNPIQSLDLTDNYVLRDLIINDLQLNELDVSENRLLINVDCSNNYINSLNFSNNIYIESVNCANNSLTALDVSNNQNNSILYFNSQNNPNLNCIQIDSGFTPPVCEVQQEMGWCKDDTTEFVVNCG